MLPVVGRPCFYQGSQQDMSRTLFGPMPAFRRQKKPSGGFEKPLWSGAAGVILSQL